MFNYNPYSYDPFFYNFLYKPFIPPDYDIPPTIYALLNSYVNFNKSNKTKINNLAKEGRGLFFDFNYSLSNKLNKEDFETMILNHYMMNRIGYDTVTAFKLQLNVKINSILPMMNKLFDTLPDLSIFDGESIISDSTDNRDISDNRNINDNKNITDNKNLNNESTIKDDHYITDIGNTHSNNENINDNRFSDEPQNQLEDVQDGSYVTNYTYNTSNENNQINETFNRNENTTKNENQSTNEKYTRNENNTTNDNLKRNDDNIHHEETFKTIGNKVEVLKMYQENLTSIYDLIFKELDDLFYSLV